MRPKATVSQRKKMIQKKNRTHWLSHKHHILVQRRERKEVTDLSQSLDPSSNAFINESVAMHISETQQEEPMNTSNDYDDIDEGSEEFIDVDENAHLSGMNQCESEQLMDEILMDKEDSIDDEELFDPHEINSSQRDFDELVCNSNLFE